MKKIKNINLDRCEYDDSFWSVFYLHMWLEWFLASQWMLKHARRFNASLKFIFLP